MCEFCTRHGEGKKWYLNMDNYSRQLLEQDGRRDYIQTFLTTFEERKPADLARIDILRRTSLAGPLHRLLTQSQKRDHFGQIVPLEDVEALLAGLAGVVRLPCVCRRVTAGKPDARYCFGLTLDRRLWEGLDDSFSLEMLTSAQALTAIRKLDKEGLVHSVWTFKTPYIGGLCNCDQDCLAYRVTYERGFFQNLFRAEGVARVDWEACNGCRACLRQCQFGAMRYSSANRKVTIDLRACFGCGVCRAACTRQAIRLLPRHLDPVAAGLW